MLNRNFNMQVKLKDAHKAVFWARLLLAFYKFLYCVVTEPALAIGYVRCEFVTTSRGY